jgi:tRNA-specific 2-thiouridylase
MRVCAHLDVPFLECDAEEAYKKGVADYMISEYKLGRVPNPDVMCNREVKFGVFWQFAREHGADFIATGHYARTRSNKNSLMEVTGVGARRAKRGRDKELSEDLFLLERGFDISKDQSYFLWTLTSEDLSHTHISNRSFAKDRSAQACSLNTNSQQLLRKIHKVYVSLGHLI